MWRIEIFDLLYPPSVTEIVTKDIQKSFPPLFFFFLTTTMKSYSVFISTFPQSHSVIKDCFQIRYVPNWIESVILSTALHRYRSLSILCMYIYTYLMLRNLGCILSAHIFLSRECLFTFPILHCIVICYSILCDRHT